MSDNKKVITFIGGGNMSSAIIAGLDRQKWRITVVEVVEAQRQKLETKFNVEAYATADEIIDHSEVVVFAVKPQVLNQVLEQLSKYDLSNRIVISIMAGIPINALKEGVKGQNIKFVRTMPNTPLFVGEGTTGVYTEDESTHDIVRSVFGATGKVFFFNNENDLNTVTAISGSGPAYFFLFIEALSKAGQELGLSKEVADAMAIQTAYGASKLASNNEDDVSVLRANVTSKEGTTDRAIKTFQAQNLDEVVKNAVFAAFNRSKELAEEHEKNYAKL